MDRLTEDRATLIANALRNNGMFAGTREWLDEHHFTQDEWNAFLDYPAELARMYEFRESNLTAGAVEVTLTFTTHKGKVGEVTEQWACFAPQSDTSKILRVAECGEVIAQLFPKQLPLDVGMALVDTATGEVVGG